MIVVSTGLDISSLLDLSVLCAFVNILNRETQTVIPFIKSRQFSYIAPMITVMTLLLFFGILMMSVRAYYFKLKVKFWTLRVARFFMLFKVLQLAGIAICILMVNNIYDQLQAKYLVMQYAIDKEVTAQLADIMTQFESLQSLCTVFTVSCLLQFTALFYKSGKLETVEGG